MSRWNDLGPTLRIAFAWIRSVIGTWITWSVRATGLLALILIVLAFTSVPFQAHRWLGTAAGQCNGMDVIVVLGGSGMPSAPELLRLHRAAELAREHPRASVHVVHPDSGDAMRMMVSELLLRGVGAHRIHPLDKGDNTRAQALAFRSTLKSKAPRVAIVTAPENMYRSVCAFRRVGFMQACGAPAWDHAMPYEFEYEHEGIGGKAWLPDVSGNTDLRYTFWNYLKLEVTCLREYAAIGYYWANGWL